jgi:hypothetical protein
MSTHLDVDVLLTDFHFPEDFTLTCVPVYLHACRITGLQ